MWDTYHTRANDIVPLNCEIRITGLMCRDDLSRTFTGVLASICSSRLPAKRERRACFHFYKSIVRFRWKLSWLGIQGWAQWKRKKKNGEGLNFLSVLLKASGWIAKWNGSRHREERDERRDIRNMSADENAWSDGENILTVRQCKTSNIYAWRAFLEISGKVAGLPQNPRILNI